MVNKKRLFEAFVAHVLFIGGLLFVTFLFFKFDIPIYIVRFAFYLLSYVVWAVWVGIGYVLYWIWYVSTAPALWIGRYLYDYVLTSPVESLTSALVIFGFASVIQAFVSKRRARKAKKAATSYATSMRNANINISTTPWQWEDDSKIWTNYTATESRVLELAYLSNPQTKVTLRNLYCVDFATMIQTNVNTKRSRRVRRIATNQKPSHKLIDPPPAASLRAVKSAGLEWSSHVKCREIKMGEKLSSKCISIPRAMSSTRSLEQHHFNIAAMQYCNLLNKKPDSIVSVDVYVANTYVEDRYYKRRSELKKEDKKYANELWVFHGNVCHSCIIASEKY